MTTPPGNRLTTRFVRMVRFLRHLSSAWYMVSIRYSRFSESEWAQYTQTWSTDLLKIFNLHTVVLGKTPDVLQPANELLVSNHISWLDIFAIFTVQVPRFVAKQEVASWPIAGAITKSARSIFINRKSRRDSARINEVIAQALKDGSCVAIFPEGTTSDGREMLPFKAALLESALIARSTIQPMAIRYLDRHGYFTTAPAYYDDISFIGSIWRILSMQSGIIEITFAEPIIVDDTIAGMNRNELTELVRQRIEACRQTAYEREDYVLESA